MAQHNTYGTLGEEIACRYLTHEEYHIIERNCRAGRFEIDIIADYFGEIIFFEVKTRSHAGVKLALEAVDEVKQRNLTEVAQAYLRDHDIDASFRFDIIVVTGTQPPYNLTHYKDAYAGEDIVARQHFVQAQS